MNDLKFPCLQCGQPMLADESQAGLTVTCPACQTAVTVPSPTAAPPTLTAIPPVIPRGPVPAPRRSGANIGLIIGIVAGGLLLLLLLGIAGLFALRSSHRPAASQHGIRAVPPESLPLPPESAAPRRDTGMSHGMKKQDQAAPPGSEISSETVTGTLGGIEFAPTQFILENGILRMPTGTGLAPQIVVITFLNNASPEGKTFVVPHAEGDRTPVPHVHLRWRENGRLKTEIVSGDYTMRLEFGQAENGNIPGKIYLEAPKNMETRIEGAFNAEMR